MSVRDESIASVSMLMEGSQAMATPRSKLRRIRGPTEMLLETGPPWYSLLLTLAVTLIPLPPPSYSTLDQLIFDREALPSRVQALASETTRELFESRKLDELLKRIVNS